LKGLWKRLRVEILFALAFLVPVLAPSDTGLGSLLLSGIGPLLPAPGPAAAPGGANEGFREAYLRLLTENARLRARLAALGEPARLVAADPAYWERNPLRIEAAVAGRDASPWRGSLVVRAGSREGVRSGMPVIVGGTLVGTVARVGPLFSRVRLLTDPGHRTWAAVVAEGRSGEGYLAGTGDSTLEMMLVPADAGRKGDPVFTAGGTPLIPRGLYVGEVESFADVDRNGVAEVEVRPALSAGEIRVVNILAVEETR
jgi:rod shape-determining protein MreC